MGSHQAAPDRAGTGAGSKPFSVGISAVLAEKSTYRTTSTAPARTLGSLPMMETLAVKEPSMLNTTDSVPRATTVRYASA